jgi:hypothetical protein
MNDNMIRQMQTPRASAMPRPSHFPEPPFAGTDHIQPILTPEELHQEGRLMHHCVDEYDRLVASGEVFVYRVFLPVRATLSIIFRDGNWIPDQLFLARNKPVSPATGDLLFSELFRSGPFRASKSPPLQCDPFDIAKDNQFPLFLFPEPGGQLPLLKPGHVKQYLRCISVFSARP